jgi:hypothetical protein
MVNPAGNGFLTAALAYAERGWPVLPLSPRGKGPYTEHGVHDATIDLDQIRGWWQGTPDANVAIRTGSGLAVLDFDAAPPFDVQRMLQGLKVPIVETERGIHAYLPATRP